VTEQCTSASLSAQPVELSVPAIDAFSCVGAALISHGKPDWCRRLPKRGDESYDIRGRRGYFAPSEQFHIDTFADRSSVEVNGQPATADQLELLRDQLAGLWQTPSVVDESCRDGGMMTIEARHAEGWKVIFRSCRHLIDRKALQPVANDKPDE